MLLERAGLPVETEAPNIDERMVEAAASDRSALEIARSLAREKALEVSQRHPARIVIGADQTLECERKLHHKPRDRAGAKKQLMALSDSVHVLNSSAAIARDGAIVREAAQIARMTMRPLNAEAVERYLDLAGAAALQSVGAYQVEGIGIHLFERVEGDHSTILGLPLLPLLQALREMKLLAF